MHRKPGGVRAEVFPAATVRRGPVADTAEGQVRVVGSGLRLPSEAADTCFEAPLQCHQGAPPVIVTETCPEYSRRSLLREGKDTCAFDVQNEG